MQISNQLPLPINLNMGASSTVPAFLTKLWTLVEDPEYDDLICWDATGKTFHVLDQTRFAKEILPLYFKHSNIASFIRQLNMYGFRKVMTIEQGGMKYEKDDMQFQHPFFTRGEDGMLEFIKRKVSNTKDEAKAFRPDDVTKVIIDVNELQGRQDHMNSRLESLKRQNEALWREVASLRNKHIKQQQIVNKLVQFLMTLVSGSNRGLSGMKRKKPLMINDASQLRNAKLPKYSRQLSIDETTPEYSVESPASSDTKLEDEDTPVKGLVIHDITEQPIEKDDQERTNDIHSENLVDEMFLEHYNKPKSSDHGVVATQTMLPPTYTNTASDNINFLDTNVISSDIDTVQQDLEQLRDILSGTTYIDSTTLSGLFSPELSLSNFDLPIDCPMDDKSEDNSSGIKTSENITGNELIHYNPTYLPTLFDLTSDTDLGSDELDFSSELPSALDTPQISISTDDPLAGFTNELPYTTTSSDDLD